MNLIKRLILISLLTIWIISFWFSIDFYYDYNETSTDIWQEAEIWNIIQTDTINNNNSALNQLLELFHLSQQDRYNSWNSKAIYYIKMIVNMLLSFVSLIALIMLIYAFYLMLFSKHESGMTKAKQMLKGVAIAIAIMWLSWFIVSFFFWIQQWSSNSNTNTTTQTIQTTQTQ